MEGVTEAPSSHHVRQAPRKRSSEVQVADITMLVRVPGRPAEVRAFTDAEEAEARSYAEQVGGTVVRLPLPMPEGYEALGGSAHAD